MPLFRKKRPEDYIKQTIWLAKRLKSEFREAKGQIFVKKGAETKLLKFLNILKSFDAREFGIIKKETGSSMLLSECMQIYQSIEVAIDDVHEKEYAKAAQLVGRIVALEELLLHGFKSKVKFAPSSRISQILNYSPKEAASKGFLFRGVSELDYEKVAAGHDIIAVRPDAKIPLLKHVLDPTNNPDTQFISLTADSNIARHFGNGRLIVLDMKKLDGNLLSPDDISNITNDTQIMRLVRKNSEYILAPTKSGVARIPAQAVVK